MKNFTKFRMLLPKNKPSILEIVTRKSAMVVLLLFSLLFSPPLRAQSKKIVLKVKEVSLETVLKSITSQSGYNFLYTNDINTSQKVSITYTGNDVEAAMNVVLANTNIDFKIQGTRIALFPSTARLDKKGKLQIKVLTEMGEPLPGAAIVVDGTQGGTMSDIKGIGSLMFSDSKPRTISVSFLGMVTEKLVWKGEKELVVRLKDDSKRLNEVVVTGFGNVSKERYTGAVTTVTNSTLESKVNLGGLSSMLEGQVAGLNTYKNDPVIRGISSFSAGYSPLLVLDGLPTEMGLADINHNDIESLTVLKDAAAASIYGVRASNGVIVIVTKSGQKGKTIVNFSATYSLTPKRSIDDLRYASTSDIIDYERNYLEYDPQYTKDPMKYFTDKESQQSKISLVQQAYYDQLRGMITADEKEAVIAKLKKNDYRKEFEKNVWRENVTQQYNFSIRKGTEKMDLSFSALLKKNQPSTIQSSNRDLLLNFKARMDIFRWMNMTVGASCNFGNSSSGLGAGGATSYMPYERLLNEDGSRSQIVTISQKQNDYLKSIKGLFGMEFNALDEMEQSYNNYKSTKLRTFTEFDITLFKGLTYNVKFGYESGEDLNSSTYLQDSYAMRTLINKFATLTGTNVTYNIPLGGRLASTASRSYNYGVRNQINYSAQILPNLSMTFFGGTEFGENNSTSIVTDIYGYHPSELLSGKSNINWDLLTKGIYGALYPQVRQSTGLNVGSTYTLNRNLSFYSNGSLSYLGKYVLAGSWRVDQTNLFGVAERNRFRPLWSISASWNASEETFLKQVEWLNMLKVRASYGLTGNVDRSSSPYMKAYVGNSVDVDARVTAIMTPPNKLLRWEKTELVNLGVDFSILKNRLSGSIEVYSKYSDDLLSPYTLDPSTGFDYMTINNGAMLNKGVEVTLNYNWLNIKDWSVSSRGQFAYNNNRVRRVDIQPTKALDLIQDSYLVVGKPYSAAYAYRWAGITADGEPSVYDKDGNVVAGSNPMKDPAAAVYVGSYDPPVTGSFFQNVRYKGLTLDAQIVFYAGHKLRNDVVPLAATAYASMKQGIADRWTENNKTAQIPKFPVYGAVGDRDRFWRLSDVHIKDASTVKLRAITLGYNVTTKGVRWLENKSLQVKAQVNNLWYWCAAGNGIDPENFGQRDGTRNGANMPSYLFSINLTL
ncbi:SusC/RagA family TonB-linked outer membrane protein [Alistipes sp. ZOR0009]|uniref:SusC/RagA family TonB-linked outer membrane protein n=1 Tax=Alistipes sp. ZOR0009 TaxID=1339253 RepID=UPI000645840C|nr:SusC/RagA family TonB-linked outer membrane protein [Alistipes sp. ZOR0009]